MDNGIAKTVEKIQESHLYSQANEFLDNLDNDSRKILGRFFALLIITFPIILLAVLFFKNHSIKNDIEVKKEIITKSQIFLGEKNNISRSLSKLISTKEIAGQHILLGEIKNAGKTYGIPGDAFDINEFQQNSPTANIVETTARINFKGMNLQNLINTISKLSKDKHIHARDISIEKSEEDTLFGYLNILHYSKAVEEVEGTENKKYEF